MIKTDTVAQNLEKMKEIIINIHHKKNSDYGNSVERVYNEFGSISLITRIMDKYHRLERLLDTSDVNFESVDDTILDAYIYAIIWKSLIHPSIKPFSNYVEEIQISEWVHEREINRSYFLDALTLFIQGLQGINKMDISDSDKNRHYLIYINNLLSSVHPNIDLDA